MGLRPLEIFYFFLCGDSLYTLKSDVYKYRDGPRAENVTTCIIYKICYSVSVLLPPKNSLLVLWRYGFASGDRKVVSYFIFTFYIWHEVFLEKGTCRFGRAPDCLASCCVPASNPADPAWVFQRNILVSPFSVWLEDSVNGGLVEFKPVYTRTFAQGHALRALFEGTLGNEERHEVSK